MNLSVGYDFDPTWFACGQSPLCQEVDKLVCTGDGRRKPDLVAPGERITSAAAGQKRASVSLPAGQEDAAVYVEDSGTSQATARTLYDAWFTTLAGQLGEVRSDRPVGVGLVGVFWPPQRWSDEPIPDFEAAGRPAAGGDAAAVINRQTTTAGSPEIDEETLAGLRETFPAGAANLDLMAELLSGEPSTVGLAGGPPSGAHSDIVHPELTWVVLKAGKIVL